jgi:hypothetical protein
MRTHQFRNSQHTTMMGLDLGRPQRQQQYIEYPLRNIFFCICLCLCSDQVVDESLNDCRAIATSHDIFMEDTKVARGDSLLFAQTLDVGTKIVVISASPFACVEFNLPVARRSNRHPVSSSECNSRFLHKFHFGAVSSRDDGHLFDATAHGSTRNILDVAACDQVIECRDMEQVVALENVARVKFIVGPSKAVAVRFPFSSAREQGDSILHVVGVLCTAKFDRADICVVTGFRIDTVLVVRFRTVSIVVGLAI